MSAIAGLVKVSGLRVEVSFPIVIVRVVGMTDRACMGGVSSLEWSVVGGQKQVELGRFARPRLWACRNFQFWCVILTIVPFV